MKTDKKISFLKKIICIFLGIIFITQAIIIMGNANSVSVMQLGLNNKYMKYYNANKKETQYIGYPKKVLRSNQDILIYCMQKKKDAPTNGTIYLEPISFEKYPALEFILENGQTTVSNVKNGGYMVGDIDKNYYITQGAIHYFLSHQPYDGVNGITGDENHNFKWILNVPLTTTEGEEIRNKIVALGKAAIEYNNNIPKAKVNENIEKQVTNTVNSKTTGDLNFNVSQLTFTDKGDRYESNYVVVNTPSKEPYSVNISGVSSPSYVLMNSNNNIISNSIESGSGFKIVILKNKINGGKYTVTATISSKGKGNSWSYYTDSGQTYQSVLIIDTQANTGGGGGGVTQKSIKGSFNYCEPEALGGKWIELKKLKFNGKTIKHGKITVGNVVQLNESYDVFLNIKYNYNLKFEVGNLGNQSNCAISDIPKPSNLNPNETGKIDYNIQFIKVNGGIIQGAIGTTNGTNFNVESGKDSYVETKVAPSIKLDVPNNEEIVKVKITAILKNSKNEKADEKVIELYIKESLEERPEDTEIKLETNLDNCNEALRESEVSVKATVSSTSIKTKNYDVKFQVSLNGGGYSDIGTKKVYGVSDGINGATYIKYNIPEKTSTGADVKSVKFKAILEEETVYSKTLNVVQVRPEKYVNKSGISKVTSSLSNGNIISYLKVEKRDKTKPIFGNCGGCTGTLETPTCPGECFIGYTWGDWYPAFMPKETIKLNNVEENYNIEKILFRSKYTKQNIGKNTNIDSKGYVDLLKLSKKDYEKFVRLKSGYGFEIILNTKYDNNVPTQIQKVDRSNQITPLNSEISEIRTYPGASKVDLVYLEVDKNLANHLTSNKPIMFVAPAADEIAYETPNKLFIQMPDKKYEELDITNGEGKSLTQKEKADIKQGQTINSEKIIRTKTFEFKSKNGFRKYYIAPNVKNSNYDSKIFTPGNGMRLECSGEKMPSDSYDMKLNVYGGYTDDVKTNLQD